MVVMAEQTSPPPVPAPTAPVVVGVDGSAGSDRALVRAAHEAAVRGAPLVVVHAWSIPTLALTAPVGVAVADPVPFADAAREVGEQARELVARQALAPTSVEVRVVEGYAVERLVEASRGAALLVVGSRGRGGFAALVLGSVADGCAHRADCPVMVVRPDAGDPDTDARVGGDVVVGLDDTPHGRAALRWASREAGRLGRRLVVIHAHDLQGASSAADGELPPGVERNFTTTGRRFIDRMIGPLAGEQQKPPSVSWRLVPDAAPSALLDAARHASLLVVGTRDRLRLQDRLLGSVSRQCLHHAPCPVVVVHEGAFDATEQRPDQTVPCAS